MAHERKDSRPTSKRRREIRKMILVDSGSTSCVHCGIILDNTSLTLDRIEPGGSYTLGNLQASCMSCNVARSNNKDWKHPQKWPAGIGPQYDWEEPRTLGGRLNPAWVEQLQGIPVGWTRITGEPEDKWREDRLRLCGNGVVPDQAELAIRALLDEL